MQILTGVGTLVLVRDWGALDSAWGESGTGAVVGGGRVAPSGGLPTTPYFLATSPILSCFLCPQFTLTMLAALTGASFHHFLPTQVTLCSLTLAPSWPWSVLRS